MRRRPYELMDQPLQCLRLLLGELGPHKHFLAGRGVDELHDPVLADADAGLWPLEPAAADALQRLQVINHYSFPVMKTAIGWQQSPHLKTVHLREQDSEARRSLGEHYLPDGREELGAEGGRAHGQGCRESVGEHRGVGNNGDRTRRDLC